MHPRTWLPHLFGRRRPVSQGPFVPGADEWLRSHVEDVPRETAHFCGGLAGVSMLNVGCGEMLTDFALLAWGARRIVGIDIGNQPRGHLEDVAARLGKAGYAVAPDWRARLDYCRYDGCRFPFGSASFDFVFSWSAFEHVGDVPRVLAEIRRVVKPAGRVFIQVYPWFPSRLGSHLTDYIPEPYFHLRRPPEWVRERLEEWAAGHPERRDFVLSHMWGEFQTLNRLSAARFLEAVREAGFTIARCRLMAHEEDLSQLPAEVSPADAMITGTMVLLRP